MSGPGAGVSRETLISEAYRAQQRALHADPRGYGGKGDRWAALVSTIAARCNAVGILDYGCGQGALGAALRLLGWVDVREYDPAVAGKEARPWPADLVACTDVLEHVEPGKVEAVIDHLARLTRKVLFVSIGLRPTSKLLDDGRQAHISLHAPLWWHERLAQRFILAEERSTYPAKNMVAVFYPKGAR